MKLRFENICAISSDLMICLNGFLTLERQSSHKQSVGQNGPPGVRSLSLWAPQLLDAFANRVGVLRVGSLAKVLLELISRFCAVAPLLVNPGQLQMRCRKL